MSDMVQTSSAPRFKYSKTFWLSLVTTIWMLGVNMFGFVDTFTNSTLSLGRTWPFTQHGLFPQTWDAQKFIEYFHRVMVSGLLILLLTLTVIVWMKYRQWVETKILSSVAVIFVLAEAALGAMAVLMASPPAVTALHMGIALIAFCGVTVLTTTIGSIDKRNLMSTHAPLRPHPVSTGYRLWSWVLLFYVLGAIYFGSFVAASGSGGAFQGWPFPTEQRSIIHWMYWVDVAHRSIALGLAIFLVCMTVAAKRREGRRDLYRTGLVLLGFTLVQAASGAALIYTDINIQAFLVHVCAVTCIFALSFYLAFAVLPEPAQRTKAGLTAAVASSTSSRRRATENVSAGQSDEPDEAGRETVGFEGGTDPAGFEPGMESKGASRSKKAGARKVR